MAQRSQQRRLSARLAGWDEPLLPWLRKLLSNQSASGCSALAGPLPLCTAEQRKAAGTLAGVLCNLQPRRSTSVPEPPRRYRVNGHVTTALV